VSYIQAKPYEGSNSGLSDSSILPEDLATQSVRLKEEQLRREEEKVRAALYYR
jgi:cell division control protein 11